MSEMTIEQAIYYLKHGKPYSFHDDVPNQIYFEAKGMIAGYEKALSQAAEIAKTYYGPRDGIYGTLQDIGNKILALKGSGVEK